MLRSFKVIFNLGWGACTFVSAWVCVCTHVYVCTCVWKPENSLNCYSSHIHFFSFDTESLTSLELTKYARLAPGIHLPAWH